MQIEGHCCYNMWWGVFLVASFPGFPRSFFLLFFGWHLVQYTEAEDCEKWERPGNTYHMNDVWWTRSGRGRGGACPSTTSCAMDDRDRWSRSCEHLTWDPVYHWSARWWSLVRYLNVDPPGPLHVHLASTRRHSCDKCSQVFPVFHALSLLCIILNANQRAKYGGALVMKLFFSYALPRLQPVLELHGLPLATIFMRSWIVWFGWDEIE